MHFFHEYSLVWEVRTQIPGKLFNFTENYSKFTNKDRL